MANVDILDQLQIDPGKLTVGQLLQERERAAHEIQRLRHELEHRVDFQVRRHTEYVRDDHAVAGIGALIRLKDVCNIVGLSRSTIYLRISEGKFPKPVRLGARAVRWRIEDIEAWKARFDHY